MAAEDRVDWTEQAPVGAESFVQLCSAMGLDLDYSPASLEGVDMVMGARSEGAVGEAGPLLVMAGCYVGEVIVRELGACWILTEPSDSLPSVKLPNGDVCNPMEKVVKLFRHGEADSVALFFSGVESALAEDAQGSV
jgi:hypothetical protein